MATEHRIFQLTIDESCAERGASDAIPVVISTDSAIDMGNHLERLDHSDRAIDMSRARDGLPFLHSHNASTLPLGRVENIYTDGHKLHGKIRVGSSERAKQVADDIRAKVLTHASVGYRVHERHKSGDVVVVTRWEPLEVSAVSIPADPSAKIGARTDAFTQPTFRTRGFNTMNTRSLDLSPADCRRYSLSRALLSMHSPGNFQADFERECSSELAKRCGSPARGIYVPDDAFRNEQRDITTGGSGGDLVEDKLDAADFISMLRNQAQVIALGATILDGQVGNLTIPRQSGTATAHWVAEDGAATESDATFDQLSLTPTTLTAYTAYSRQTLLQATPSIDRLVRNDLVKTVAIEIDRAAINGSGSSNQPTGILQTSGIGSVAIGTNGGTPTWASIVQLQEALADANALTGSLGFLTNSAVASTLMQTAKIGSTYPVYILDAPYNQLLGYPFRISNNVPDTLTKGTSSGDCSAIIFANWQDLIIARWGAPIDILSDPYSGSTTGSVKLISFSTMAIGVRHPVSFAADVDYTTT